MLLHFFNVDYEKTNKNILIQWRTLVGEWFLTPPHQKKKFNRFQMLNIY